MTTQRRRNGIAGAAMALAVLAGATASPSLALETKARHALLTDFRTGAVLFEKDAGVSMPPSSMSKLMTAYMLFERIRAGDVSLDDEFLVSENAWRKGGAASGGSTMFLEPGTTVRVEELLRGIIIQSGNDACIVVAENLSGSEAAFAQEMNEKGRELGLTDSNFMNATGLPDPDHRMTAKDLAVLANRIITDFPQYYGYYSETEFSFNDITQYNRNPLLYRFDGADGLKTGHTQAAGYGLTASAKRGNRRLILVVNGLNSTRERSEESRKLLEWGFRSFRDLSLYAAGETVGEVDVWMGEDLSVGVSVDEDVLLSVANRDADAIEVRVRYDWPLTAPIMEGQVVGDVVVRVRDEDVMTIPARANGSVEELGMFGRLMRMIYQQIPGAGS